MRRVLCRCLCLVLAVAAGVPARAGGRDPAADCALWRGAEAAPGIPSLGGRCVWPALAPPTIAAVLGVVDGHDRFVWTLVSDRLVDASSGISRVHHRHELPGIAPREGTVWIQAETLPDGGLRVRWASAPCDDCSPDSVVIARNEGAWEVRPAAAGGAEVWFELSFAPGGSVPAWLVRWMQEHGARRVLRDLYRESLAAARLTAASLPAAP